MDRRIGRRTIGPLVSFLALAFLLFSFYGTATPTSFSDGDGTTPNILIIYNTSGSLAGSGAPPGTSAENMNITLSDAGGNVTIWNITAEGRLPTLAEANFYNATIYTQGTRNQTLNDETMAFLDAYLYGDVGHLIIEGQNVLNDAGLIEGNTTFVERVLRCDSSDIINRTDVGTYTSMIVSDSTHPITYGITSTTTTYSTGLQDDIWATPPAKIVIAGAGATFSDVGAVNTWENTTTEHRAVYMAFPWNESTSDTIDDQTFRDELLINCVNWVRDYTKPTANITHPAQDVQLSGTVTVNGTASDIDDGTGVKKVELTWDNGLNWYLVNGNTSWTYQWHTAAVPSANYTLIARATDYAGNYNDSVGVNVTVYNAGGEAKPYGSSSIIVTVNRYIILDDPNDGTNDTGYSNPKYYYDLDNYWDGENTTIRVHVLTINNTGLADANLNVTFKLKYSNGTVIDTAYVLTDSNGLASYSYDMDARNHWGEYNVTVNATQLNKTGYETNTIESTTFIYNWWGCGDCHGDAEGSGVLRNKRYGNPDLFGVVTPNSPYTEGFDEVHMEYSHYLGDNNCLKCHKSYGTGSAGYQTPAGQHSQNISNQQYCQDCHEDGSTIRAETYGIPHMPSCYNASCHPQFNTHPAVMHILNDSMTDSQGQSRMFYSGDPYDPSKPMPAHEPGPHTSVPCISCHGIGHNIHSPYPDGAGNSVTELELCICCHTGYIEHNNKIGCMQVCHGQDVHDIDCLNFTGNLTSDRTQAVNCTSCHQTSALPAEFHGVDVHKPLNHSNNNSGQRWGDYWTDDLTSCLYCHGDTMHTGLSLGWVRRFQGNNVPNSTINSTNWCASCHWVGYESGDANYTTMTDAFAEAGLPIPPEITNGTNWNGTYSGYYNHTLGNYDDNGCKDCHYDPFTTDKMTEFTHNVSEGIEADPDCVRCHDLGYNAPKHVDVTVMKTSTHVNLNKNAVNVSRLTDDIDKACWGCHGEDGNADGLANETEQPTGEHPANYKTPRNCLDCHNNTAASNFGANQTYGHTWYSTKINTPAVTWCTDCHAKSEMIMPNSDPDEGTNNATSSHYERKRTDLRGFIGDGIPGNYCGYCHQDTSTVFPFLYEENKSMSFHSPDISTTPECSNPYCHRPYALHEEGLVNPTWFTDANCSECHSEEFHNGTVTCTDCHLETPADIHPIHYLQHDGVTYSTAKKAAADCQDCHESTKADATIGKTSPQVPSQHHSNDLENGTKWGNYWNYTKHATTFVTNYANTTGTVANFTNAQSTAANYTTIAEENVSGVYRYNVTFDFTDVVDYVNKTLELDYKIHGEDCTMSVYNGTVWNPRATLDKGAFAPITYELTSDEYVDGNVSVRFVDEIKVNDTVPSSIDVKYFYVHSDTGLLYPCGYCHHPNMHYEDALGMPSSYKGNNIENQSIDAGNWCAGCHYQGYVSGTATYDDMVVAFQNASLQVPPEITGNATYGADQSHPDYYNHSGFSDYLDGTCHSCHGKFVSIDAGTTQFVHNVAMGAAGPDCVMCHDVGKSFKRVDVSVMNDTDAIHNMLNNGTAGLTLNPDNERCWACHGDGNGTEAAQPADDHPVNYTTPKNCDDCHITQDFNATIVEEHYSSGADIKTDTSLGINESCISCHNETEMKLNHSSDPYGVKSAYAAVSHYGKNRTSDLASVGVTNCSYCHENVTTTFPFVNSGLKNVKNHTSRATNPDCTNSTCHKGARIHNATLQKPTVDYAFCQNCHADRYRHNGTVECYKCHGNATYKIHPILYLNYDNTTSTTNASAVNCTSCHQSTAVDGSLTLYPPKVSTSTNLDFNHSDNASAGQLWGNYWNSSIDLTACQYCHNDTTHNVTAIGPHASITAYGDVVNATITNTSFWCAGCHYQGDVNYSETVSSFESIGKAVPPEITNGTYAPYTVAGYYNHSFTDWSDYKCRSCHVSGTAERVTPLLHNIAIGTEGGPDCIACHGLGAPGSNYHVNVSAMNSTDSIHVGLNADAVNSTNVPADNKICWGCHQSDGVQPGTGEHPDRRSNPWMCRDCHTGASKYNASIVHEHYSNGTDVKTNTTQSIEQSCSSCHTLDEMLIPANDPDAGTFDIDNDGHAGGNTTAYHYGRTAPIDTMGDATATEGCVYCHLNATNAAKWSNATDPSVSTARPHVETDNEDCYACHIEGGESVSSFHHEWLYLVHPKSPPAYPIQKPSVELTTNRIVVLDDPNQGQNGTGFSPPQLNWTGTDYWSGESTTIRAYALIFNNTGLPATGVNVTFTLKNPGEEINDTQYNTTGPDGIAQYSFDLNAQNYYGNWTLNTSCTMDNVSITSNFTFIYSWWGCANCHEDDKANPPADPAMWGVVASRSPYMMGYDPIHTNTTTTTAHTGRVNDSECLYCHQSYGNNFTAGSQTPTAGFHNGTYCQDCHARGNGTWLSEGGNGNGTPDILSCYNSSCHSRTDISNKTTLSDNNSTYSGDPSTPLKYHDSGSKVPCVICHHPMHAITSPYPSGKGNTTTEDQHCTKCHLDKKHSPNNPVNCTQCHSEDVHVIKFITNSTTQTTPDYNISRSLTATCMECHNVSGLNDYFVNQSYSPNATDSHGYNLTKHDNVVRCETCHDRMHWIGYLNSTGGYGASSTNAVNCTECHFGTNGDVKAVVSYWGYTAPVKSKHNGTVNCTGCHGNSQHGIRYLQHGSASFVDDTAGKSTAVDCTDCHQNTTMDSLIITPRVAPKIPAATNFDFNHSSDPSAGGKWGNYWDNTSDMTACIYCHSNTTHKVNALGQHVSIITYNDTRNTTISSTSFWCAGCHYQGDVNYTETVTSFGNRGLNVPPEITGNATYAPGTAADGTSYYDHTELGMDVESCKNCHGALLSASPTTAEFVHNVGEGAAGPDCVSCHDVGKTAPVLVDVSAMNTTNSIHKDLNKDANTTLNPDNKRCWACHGDGTEPSGHPSNYKTPRDCEDCHVGYIRFNASKVSEHYVSGEDVQAYKPCRTCHKIGYNTYLLEIRFNESVPASEINEKVSHYGEPLHETCRSCHQNTTADDYGVAKLVYKHANNSCTVCHASPRTSVANLHDVNLTIPLQTCKDCHTNDYWMWSYNGPGQIKSHYPGAPSYGGDTRLDDYTCEYCHGLSTTQKLHSDSLTVTRWDCVDCHSSTGTGPTARYVTKIDTYAHYESYVDCGDNCHASSQKFHYPTHALGDVVDPGWSGWIFGRSVSCPDCHVSHPGEVPFNAPPDHGARMPNCEDCHRSPEADTWIKFVHNVVTVAGPDCGRCHETMVTVIGSSVHAGLNVEATNETALTDPAAKACWACHGDGTEPLGHPVGYENPANCLNCHITHGEAPYNASDISVLPKGQATLEECLVCHNQTHVAVAGRKMGPLAKDVILSPSLAIWGDRVALNTRIDEYFLTVKRAEYFIDVVSEPGTGIPMNATDGTFNGSKEDVWAAIDTEELSIGNHTIYVHAMDSAGTWGPVSSTTLTVSGETWFDFCLKIWRASIGMLYQAYKQAYEWYRTYAPFIMQTFDNIVGRCAQFYNKCVRTLSIYRS